MKCVLLLLSLLCLGVGTTVCRAEDWVQPHAQPLPGPIPSYAPGCTSCAPCEAPACRPGLIARIRDRLHSGHCDSCCNPRPGLLERLRARRAERHAGCCCTPAYP
jgi:hypothetical protein